MIPPDGPLSQWLTSLVGNIPVFDKTMGFLASDFFTPAVMCLILLWLWFGSRSQEQKDKNQRAIMIATSAFGIACLVVYKIDPVTVHMWSRPFDVYENAAHAVDTLFYRSHDPSFPSNSAALSFGMATGVFFGNRKAGIILFILSAIWAFSRIYVGSHYVLDIVGGALIGIVICYFFKFFLPRIEPIPTLVLKLARKLHFA